jgi:HEPN domain-containing protein
MCHPSIEKILKAYYVKVLGETPPYIHDLIKLAEKSGLANYLSKEYNDFLEELNPLNIEARYPKYKDEIYEMVKGDNAKVIMDKSKELREWINGKL